MAGHHRPDGPGTPGPIPDTLGGTRGAYLTARDTSVPRRRMRRRSGRPATAQRAAAASVPPLRTPPTPPHAAAPSPVAGTCAWRPQAAVTAVTCAHGPPVAMPMAVRWRTIAAARQHLHLRERDERGCVSRGRSGRGVGVAQRQLRREATAATARTERVRARAGAARTPRNGSVGGRWRGRRRCQSRRRRCRGARPSCRRRRRRSRATWRYCERANGAVSSRQMGQERANWAPS